MYLKSIFLFPLNQLEIIKITFWNYSLKFISPFSVYEWNNYPAKEYQNAVEQRKGDKSKLSILPRNNKCYPPRESASNWKEFKWIFLQYLILKEKTNLTRKKRNTYNQPFGKLNWWLSQKRFSCLVSHCLWNRSLDCCLHERRFSSKELASINHEPNDFQLITSRKQWTFNLAIFKRESKCVVRPNSWLCFVSFVYPL